MSFDCSQTAFEPGSNDLERGGVAVIVIDQCIKNYNKLYIEKIFVLGGFFLTKKSLKDEFTGTRDETKCNRYI